MPHAFLIVLVPLPHVFHSLMLHTPMRSLHYASFMTSFIYIGADTKHGLCTVTCPKLHSILVRLDSRCSSPVLISQELLL